MLSQDVLGQFASEQLHRIYPTNKERLVIQQQSQKEKHLVFIDQVRGEEFDSQLNKFFFSPNKNDINNYWRDLNYFFNLLENLLQG